MRIDLSKFSDGLPGVVNSDFDFRTGYVQSANTKAQVYLQVPSGMAKRRVFADFFTTVPCDANLIFFRNETRVGSYPIRAASHGVQSKPFVFNLAGSELWMPGGSAPFVTSIPNSGPMVKVVWPDNGGASQTRYYLPLEIVGDFDRVELELVAASGVFSGLVGIGCLTEFNYDKTEQF